MFTGIVQAVGVIAKSSTTKLGATFWIDAPEITRSLEVGDSVCTQGVCLTAVSLRGEAFCVDVSAETLRRTTLGAWAVGTRANLELPLTLSDRLGGHLVSGHVDGVGQVVAVEEEGAGRIVTFQAPPSIMRYTIEKGSVTIDGVSLTLFALEGDRFKVALIPHTLEVTTLGALKAGDRVNLEADMIGKYVERLMPRA